MKIDNIRDIKNLIENKDIEIKKAANSFPKDALETYSAFANTNGGYLIFGISENEDNSFSLTGVENTQKILKEMFDMLNNRKNINKNLIDDKNILCKTIDNKEIIIIYIPSAKYTDKPIYLNGNPYKSYYRMNSSDYLCEKEIVDAMIRDSSPISFDNTIVKNFTIDDLDLETITKYRNYFSQIKKNHPYNNYDNITFLVKLGAMVPDRESNIISPTIAGLLVFGKSSSIRERLPHYHVEYIDKIDVGILHDRWRDRVIDDGTWGEGNLYNFFFTVINKLYLTLKNNFELDENSISRKEDSPMRTAIREAFVNSIIHNDFQNTRGIIISRLNNSFKFVNGGTLRISRERFFLGEYSEPRNHNIQKIFNMINLSERAGTGIPKIIYAVKTYNLLFPELNILPGFVSFDFFDISEVENATDLTDIEKRVFIYILNKKYIKRLDIDKEFKIQKIESLRLLNSLVEKGYIEKFGHSVSTTYKPYNKNKFSTEIEIINNLAEIQEFFKNKIK